MAKRKVSKATARKVVKKALKEANPSKMELATRVYQDMTKRGLPRKAIVQAFQDDVKLTKAGASTYYQLIGKKLA